ncbi:hypothetical protein QTH97_30685 [Variovorax sp. J22R24]|uniref:hypothetical protein n=1 Tax=Variovorax gracilis TaxID=3053502 RepID=UPI0025761931|nr:hypothetical protein [Variovorax sp. J22R24]MDM0109333.1 hypothetical protein [Variovorax sp. J22R24]
MALSTRNWKLVFMEQRGLHDEDLGRAFRSPADTKSFKSRTDPYERADITSNTYYDWFINHDPQIKLGTIRRPSKT